MRLIEVALDGCVFDGPVHSLGLAVGPGMIRLRQSMFDAMLETNAIEDMRSKKAPGGSFTVLGQIREGHAIVGEDLVYFIRKSRDDVTEERGSFHFAGVFVELEPGLEGLLHISEISDQKVEKPEDMLKVGQELEVKILRVDSEERKIGLSLKRAQWAQEEEARESARAQRAEKRGLRGGLEGGEQTRGLGDIDLNE